MHPRFSILSDCPHRPYVSILQQTWSWQSEMHFSRPLVYVSALLVLEGTIINKNILFFRNLSQERECMKPWTQGLMSSLFRSVFFKFSYDSLQACVEKLELMTFVICRKVTLCQWEKLFTPYSFHVCNVMSRECEDKHTCKVKLLGQKKRTIHSFISGVNCETYDFCRAQSYQEINIVKKVTFSSVLFTTYTWFSQLLDEFKIIIFQP